MRGKIGYSSTQRAEMRAPQASHSTSCLDPRKRTYLYAQVLPCLLGLAEKIVVTYARYACMADCADAMADAMADAWEDTASCAQADCLNDNV